MTEYVVYNATEGLRGTRKLYKYGEVEAEDPEEAANIVSEDKGGGLVMKRSSHPLSLEKYNAIVVARSNLHSFKEVEGEEFSDTDYDKGQYDKYHVFHSTGFKSWFNGLGAGEHPAIAVQEITEDKLTKLEKTDNLDEAEWLAIHPTNPTFFGIEAFERLG